MGKTSARAYEPLNCFFFFSYIFVHNKRKGNEIDRLAHSITTYVQHTHRIWTNFMANSWYRNKLPSIGLLVASYLWINIPVVLPTSYEYYMHNIHTCVWCVYVKMGVPSRKFRKRNEMKQMCCNKSLRCGKVWVKLKVNTDNCGITATSRSSSKQ